MKKPDERLEELEKKFKSIREVLESLAIECQELEKDIEDEDQPYDAYFEGRYLAMTNILNRFSKIIN